MPMYNIKPSLADLARSFVGKDLLWMECYCYWPQVLTIMKRAKKWRKHGLFVDVIELEQSDVKRLREVHRTATIDRQLSRTVAGDEGEVRQARLLSQMFHPGVFASHSSIAGDACFHVRLMGPRIRNNEKPDTKPPVEQVLQTRVIDFHGVKVEVVITPKLVNGLRELIAGLESDLDAD